MTNSTSGGTAEQIRYLVNAGCIPPMCELLTVMDTNIVQVALNGLENILKSGDQCCAKPNPYAVLVEECYGESLHFTARSCKEFMLILVHHNLFQALTKSNFSRRTRKWRFMSEPTASCGNTLATTRKSAPMLRRQRKTMNFNLPIISESPRVDFSFKFRFCRNFSDLCFVSKFLRVRSSALS